MTHPTSPRLRSRLAATLGSSALWKGIAFLLLKFPVALATWVVSLVSLVVPLAFALVPFAWLVDPDGFHVGLGFWQPASFLGTLPFGIAGAAGFLVALHLQVGMGWLWARLAEGLLGSNLPAAPAPLAPLAPTAPTPAPDPAQGVAAAI